MATAGACALFVIGAVTLEVLAGTGANSDVPEWAEVVPATWPRAARVTWWLAVAGAAGLYRLCLRHLGLRPNRLVTAMTLAPFLVFALGIAIGSEWTAWH